MDTCNNPWESTLNYPGSQSMEGGLDPTLSITDQTATQITQMIGTSPTVPAGFAPPVDPYRVG